MNISGYEVEHIIDGLNNVPCVYGHPSLLSIGQNVGLNNTIFNCSERITVENDVFFGHNVMVLTGIHDIQKRGNARMVDVSRSKPVRIGRGAWIASGAIIMPGVTIGEGAVIGAGSIVTKDVPPLQVWIGSPAKFIKHI